MKVWGIFILSLISIGPQFLCADLPGAAPSTINKPNTNPFPKAAPPKEKPLPQPKISKPTMGVKGAYIPFTLPGIIGVNQGRWEGSDNLYNLNPNISIYIEVVMPENASFNVDEKEIKAKIEEIFSKAGISPLSLYEHGEVDLPLFHVLIMLNSIDQCLSAFCACRLFEAVNLKRVILEQGITFQAVTWEKQDLVAATKKDFYPLLDRTIDNLTEAFVERFQYFQNIRIQKSIR